MFPIVEIENRILNAKQRHFKYSFSGLLIMYTAKEFYSIEQSLTSLQMSRTYMCILFVWNTDTHDLCKEQLRCIIISNISTEGLHFGINNRHLYNTTTDDGLGLSFDLHTTIVQSTVLQGFL